MKYMPPETNAYEIHAQKILSARIGIGQPCALGSSTLALV